MPIGVTRKTVSTPAKTTPAKATPKAAALKLAKALLNASDPGQMAATANSAMKFLMSPSAKSLSVSDARKLHMALGDTLKSLDAGAGWVRPQAGNAGTKALLKQLNSGEPGEIGTGVKSTMAFLTSPAAQKLDSSSRNQLFKALGSAQGALQELEAGMSLA